MDSATLLSLSVFVSLRQNTLCLFFFGSKLLGYPRAVRPSVSSNYRNGQIQLWTKTFIPKNEFIKQINKHINSPRSSDSKTRKPFLESSHRRCTGRSAESSHWVGDTCDKSAFDRRKGSTDDERYLENKTCWLASPVKLKPQGDRRRAWKLWENRWNAKNSMSFMESNNSNPTKTHTPKEKTFSELSETVKQRFQNKKPSEHSDPLHDDIEKFRK